MKAKRTVDNHKEPWSREDVRLLRLCAQKKLSGREAGEVLGRTRGAVAYKAMVEGIHFHAIEQARGVQRRRSVRAKIGRARRRTVRRKRRAA